MGKTRGKANAIEWKNIYYMICYCVDELKYFNEDLIEQEEIKGTHDLLAQLLINSFEILYRNGYIKKYRQETIVTDKPYGKIDLAESIRTGNYAHGKLVCTVDIMDINNKLNQIIKAAFTVLIESNNIIDDKINDKLLSQLYYCRDRLKGVDSIDITYQLLSNKTDIPEWYKPIFAVCKMILSDWLALDEDGNIRLLELNDNERLKYIFEKFVRNFYGRECNQAVVTRPTIRRFGRTRIFDAMLENNNTNKVLVIDTKYYENTGRTVHNEDQINTYTSHIKTSRTECDVSGILLYACDDETMNIKEQLMEEGYTLAVWQLSINDDIETIKDNLITIADKYTK